MRYLFGEPSSDAEVVRRFQELFDSELGHWVMHFLLSDLGFFDTEVPPEERPLQDWAKHLLRLCGAWNERSTTTWVRNLLATATRPIVPQGETDGQQ